MTSSTAAASLERRVAEVRERIVAAAERSGRSANDVTLIAVTKTWPAETVAEALGAGLVNFGENRVQEGVAKAESVAQLAPEAAPTWHLIGHLQTNKVRAALGCFAKLHSVDSERLLLAISTAATKPVPLLIEVNVSNEATKDGIAVAELPGLLAFAAGLPNLDVRGLMTVAPHVPNPNDARPVFRELRGLAEHHGLKDLSMGMTNDYEVAIEEGSTCVRVGRALFGDRA